MTIHRGVSDEEILAWLGRRREMVEDLMRAENLVEHGTIQITFHDGRYVGMDAMARRRLRTSGSEAAQTG